MLFFLFVFFQSVIFGLQDRYFKISESREFYLSQVQDAEDLNELKDEPFFAISLGHNCWPAAHLQDHALRKRSFPLDWMNSSFDSVYSLFETDFYGFLDIRYIDYARTSAIHGAQFGHDFNLANWKQEGEGIIPLNETAKQEYEEMLSRYQKRIARFYAIFELGVPVYLFRWRITNDQAYKLYDLLTKKFPNSEIYLICLHDDGINMIEDWSHPRIKHFPIGWDGKPLGPMANRSRNTEWTKIFSELGLLVYRWNTND